MSGHFNRWDIVLTSLRLVKCGAGERRSWCGFIRMYVRCEDLRLVLSKCFFCVLGGCRILGGVGVWEGFG